MNRKLFFLSLFIFINLLGFAKQNFRVELHNPYLPKVNGDRGKVFIRNINDKRKQAAEDEGITFEQIGNARNGYGVVIWHIATYKNRTVDILLEEMYTSIFENSGYEVVSSEEEARFIMDIDVEEFWGDGYVGYFFNTRIKLVIFDNEGKSLLTKVIDVENGFSLNSYGGYANSISQNFHFLMQKSIYFIQSNVFNAALAGEKPADDYSVLLERDEAYQDALKKVNPDSLFFLNLAENKIGSLKGLSKYNNLVELDLKTNSFDNFASFNKLNNLKVLNLRNNDISSFDSLKNNTSIESLDLGYNSINSFKGLEKLENLKWLSSSFNRKIRKMDGIGSLKNLFFLSLHNLKNLKSIGEINKLPNLSYLQISSCSDFEKLEGFENMTNLRELSISESDINKMGGLSPLVNLEYLNMSYTDIKKLEKMESFKKLKTLVIVGTKIRKLDSLHHLDSLEHLVVSDGVGYSKHPWSMTKKSYAFLRDNNVLINYSLTVKEFVKKYDITVVEK